MSKRFSVLLSLALIGELLWVAPTLGQSPEDGDKPIVVTIENHVFSPSEIHVPAGRKIELLVQNHDDVAEEFDSTSLKVEKVIAGRGEAVVRLRRLDPGTYPFIGEYHSDTAKGTVVAE